MQIKLFTIPVGDSGGALAEMNSFLKTNKILEVQNHMSPLIAFTDYANAKELRKKIIARM